MGNKAEPLTESYFFILLCLYRGPNHGYGIMQQTLTLSNGNVRIGSGTMYGATSQMMKRGWIEECHAEGFDRKRQYRLTEEGRRVLKEEAERLRHLVRTADDVMGGEER
ncbi:MAG: helix-turn-helix transcriptional regulator [Agathobacter sp.]|nr:helix-turn-helix transcriptional regulator [Agathobacter sp.]